MTRGSGRGAGLCVGVGRECRGCCGDGDCRAAACAAIPRGSSDALESYIFRAADGIPPQSTIVDRSKTMIPKRSRCRHRPRRRRRGREIDTVAPLIAAQLDQVLRRERRGGSASVENSGHQLALFRVQGEDRLLDRVAGHQAIDRDRALLADPVGAVGGLVLDRRIPPGSSPPRRAAPGSPPRAHPAPPSRARAAPGHGPPPGASARSPRPPSGASAGRERHGAGRSECPRARARSRTPGGCRPGRRAPADTIPRSAPRQPPSASAGSGSHRRRVDRRRPEKRPSGDGPARRETGPNDTSPPAIRTVVCTAGTGPAPGAAWTCPRGGRRCAPARRGARPGRLIEELADISGRSVCRSVELMVSKTPT